MNVVAVIAARMASSRYPGKPLVPIRGIPMIGHVFHRSRIVRGFDDVWMATCDQVIMDYSASIGAPAVMTADTHRGATDRIAEAVPYIEQKTGKRIDVAVLVQGDEPMLVPEMLEELVAPMRAGTTEVANLIAAIEDDREFTSPDTVKVVRDRRGRILYLSREPIPSRSKFKGAVPMWKQLGLIAFTRDALATYARLGPTPLEEVESVDMNRMVEHGISILTVETTHRSASVDTPADHERVERLMADDPYLRRYA